MALVSAAGVAIGIYPLVSNPLAGADLLILGAAVAGGLAMTSVALSRRDATHWSAAGFVMLVQSVALGPWGAFTSSLAVAAGSAIRLRLSDIRVAFNLANLFLSDLAAWWVFSALAPAQSSIFRMALAGAVAGVAQYAVNLALLSIARWASADHVDWRSYLRVSIPFAGYSVGYGWAAAGGLALYRAAGIVGVSALYVPIVLVQVFLISMARRIEAEEQEEAAHVRERDLLLERVRVAADVERGRIVRELHDGVVQDLAALTSGLRTRASQTSDDEGARVLVRAADAAQDAMSELRTLLREIAPPDLEDIGLKAAIEGLLEPLREQGVDCTVAVADDIDATPALRPVFRIAQEAVRNVVKHAQARTVSVTAVVQEGHVVLEVRDDGLGYDTEQARRRRAEGHIGVQLIQDLAAEAGGVLSIESAPGEGTVVRASIPMEGRS